MLSNPLANPLDGEMRAQRRGKRVLPRFLSSRNGSPARQKARARARRFVAYYRPHLPLLMADLICAVLVAATAVAMPLIANHVINRLQDLAGEPDALRQILILGGAMLGVFLAQAFATYFVDYQGHVMGAKIEAQVRRELFEHCQKLSYRPLAGRKLEQFQQKWIPVLRPELRLNEGIERDDRRFPNGRRDAARSNLGACRCR